MSVSQISVFLESRPGHLKKILDDFVSAGINVRGYSASDTGDYGIVRFIVDKPTEALSMLEQQGCAATTTQVLCVKLLDTPGELARILGILSDCHINIDYSYSLIATYIALHTADCAEAEALLADRPVELAEQADLQRTLEEN